MLGHNKYAEWTGRILLALILVLVFLVPFYWMALTALKTQGETLRFPPGLWVSDPQWQNFSGVTKILPVGKYLLNSIIVTLSILAFQAITVIPAAYAFARYRFKGRDFLFAVVLATMMIPAQLIFLPVFLLLSGLGLINTYWSLILPAATSAFGIFLLRQTFLQVPEEILEAARLDKADEWKIIVKIMVPLARPTLATLGLLTFIGSWNDYFWPLVLTTNDDVRTLPLGIVNLRMMEGGVSYHTVMAGNLMLVAPIVAVFLVAQRYVIKAFTYMGGK